jgi:hypothetical protein
LSFDEPLLRQAFYQTLQPVYLTNTSAISVPMAYLLFLSDCGLAPALVFSSRYLAQRFLCASAIFALPWSVFGPVDLPPCIWHFVFPGTTRFAHIAPMRISAPQAGRPL